MTKSRKEIIKKMNQKVIDVRKKEQKTCRRSRKCQSKMIPEYLKQQKLCT